MAKAPLTSDRLLGGRNREPDLIYDGDEVVGFVSTSPVPADVLEVEPEYERLCKACEKAAGEDGPEYGVVVAPTGLGHLQDGKQTLCGRDCSGW